MMDIQANLTGLNKAPIEDFKRHSNNVEEWFLMGSPVPLLVLTTSYIIFVLKLGPTYMKSRPPLNLNNTIVFYNVIQVIYSLYLVIVGGTLFKSGGLFNQKVGEDLSKELLYGAYLYFLAKITELLDTIFFTLRKKQNQVTFLHVYHHTAMIWNTWVAMKYDPSYTLLFLGTVNSFVHVVMYAYYGLSTFPALSKYLWWKKYITVLQLTQFVLVIIHALFSVAFGCPISKFMLTLVLFNALLFIILFSDFYKKSYTKKDNSNSKKIT